MVDRSASAQRDDGKVRAGTSTLPFNQPNRRKQSQPTCRPPAHLWANQPTRCYSDQKAVVEQKPNDRRCCDVETSTGHLSGPFADPDHEPHKEPRTVIEQFRSTRQEG